MKNLSLRPPYSYWFHWNLQPFATMRKAECIPVGCVPSAAVAISRGGVCSGGCLLLGVGSVCSWGVSAPGGCLLWGVCSGGCLLWGVSALGGVCSWGVSAHGGCLLPGGVSAPGGSAPGVSAPRGVSATREVSAPRGDLLPGGCPLPGGCLLWGDLLWGMWYPSMHWGRHPHPSPLWTDRRL